MTDTSTDNSETQILLHHVDWLSGELYATSNGRPGYVEDRQGNRITSLSEIADELAAIVSSPEVSSALRTDYRRAKNLRNLCQQFFGDTEGDLQARLRSTDEGRQALIDIDRGNQNRILEADKGVLTRPDLALSL